MSKKASKSDIVKHEAPAALTKYMEDDTSLEALAEHVVVGRLKVVQALSADEMKAEHGEGSVVLMPGNARIIARDEYVDVVAVFFFNEFCIWSHRDDNQSPMIHDRTFDAKSELALRCRATKYEDRFENYIPGDVPKVSPDGTLKRRYVEHLNYACYVYSKDHPQKGTPVILSFQKGDFMVGRNLASAVSQRKIEGKTAPLWANVWRLTISQRERKGNKWWGIDPSNPTNDAFGPVLDPFITEDEIPFFHGEHVKLKELHDAQRLVVDRTTGEDDEDEVDVDGKEY